MGAITTLFFDIGGVCLTNGWDHEQRHVIADQFGFDYEAFDSRHRQIVDSLERGFISLDEYLNWTLFYEARPFTPDEITQAIKQLSAPFDDTLALVRKLHESGRYRLMAINNESRELNEYRIERFGLRDLFMAFFTSCYLGTLKPQPEHYRRALEISQRHVDECLYIDDRPMNVEVARILGMHPIHFTSAEQLEHDLRDASVTF
jgi:putative hydrolase of the HAD superfamily